MGKDTPQVILLRKALPKNKNDIPMCVARILITINLQISIATVGNPLRKQIWSTFKIK